MPANRERHHDIDGARSVLMFLSVLLHAGTVYAPARPWITGNIDRLPFFDWLIFGFTLFVTPTFFLVGGFFTVILLRRSSIVEFLKIRFVRAGIPLVTIALSLNIVENHLRYRDSGGPLGFGDWLFSDAHARIWASGEWQLHLWFLVCLIPFFILSAAVHGALPARAAARDLAVRLADRIGRWGQSGVGAVLLLLGLAMLNTANYALVSRLPGAYDLIAPGFVSPWKLVSELPFFLIGVMAGLSPAMLKALRGWRWWTLPAALALLVWQPYPEDGAGWAGEAAFLFLNQLAVWAIVLAILRIFHRFFSGGNAARSWLADAALSMYLLHHCLVYVYGSLFVPVAWHPAAEFALVAALAAGSVLLFHEYGIRRYRLLRLLFNGKTDIDRIRAPAPPARSAAAPA